jgi:hypothetical protein
VLPFDPVMVPDDEYWPGASRVTLPAVVAVLPSGPVRVPVWAHVPLAQLVSPACWTEFPYRPVAVPEFENCPVEVRVTVPLFAAKPPYGPATPPACEQLPPPQEP